MLRILSLMALLFTVLVAAGCGTDCESICQEAQDQDCTTIDGNCSTVCNAAEAVSDKAGCSDALDNWVDCSADGTVCTTDARCSSQESVLATCAYTYCSANPDDRDCVDLSGAF